MPDVSGNSKCLRYQITVDGIQIIEPTVEIDVKNGDVPVEIIN